MLHFDDFLILVEEFLEVLHADFFTQNLTNLLTLVVTCGFARANRFFGNECEECQCNRAYEHRTPTSDFSNCCHFFTLFFIDFYYCLQKSAQSYEKSLKRRNFSDIFWFFEPIFSIFPCSEAVFSAIFLDFEFY